jgi:hypothetical protein
MALAWGRAKQQNTAYFARRSRPLLSSGMIEIEISTQFQGFYWTLYC